jgi:hypothetical protein
MKKKLLLSALFMVMTLQGAWAAIGGTGTESDPYTINSSDDWNDFCASLANKTYKNEFKFRK